MEISLLLDSKSIFGITILNLSALKFHINYFFLYFTYFFITGIFYSINKISNSKDITPKTVYTKIGNDSQIYTRDQPFQKVIILLGKHTQVFFSFSSNYSSITSNTLNTPFLSSTSFTHKMFAPLFKGLFFHFDWII
jgi:hypothetical protein